MNGGNGNIVGLLERIAGAQEATNDRLDQTNKRLDQAIERIESVERQQQRTNEGIAHLREDVNEGFRKVDDRFDHVLKFMGARNTDHEERIRALEEQVFKKSS